MTALFRRSARIVVDTIELALDPIDPTQSLDVSFSIDRSLEPEPNAAQVQIWNLNPDHRSQLEELDKVPVSVEAGYEGQTSLIFLGSMRTVYTIREGADLLTLLESGDGETEYQQSRINVGIASGTSNTSVLDQIVKSLKIGRGNLDTFAGQITAAKQLFPQGGAISGQVSRVMTEITASLGFTWSIQNGAIQLLPRTQSLTGKAVSLTPSTGLVGSPSVDNKGVLTAQCLLIPDVFPGRLLVLESERLSGNYKVEKCRYTGDTASTNWYIDIEAKKL